MAHDDDKTLFKGMKWLIWCGIIAAIILAVLFFLNQTYDRTLPVDTGIFGTYGDFIGGVLGTIIALYSAYLLIKTLQNQATINKDIEKTNASVVTTNESIVAANAKADAAAQQQYYQNALQIFDGKFSRFFDSYQRAVSAYESEPLAGRAAFDKIAGFLLIQHLTTIMITKGEAPQPRMSTWTFMPSIRLRCRFIFECYICW